VSAGRPIAGSGPSAAPSGDSNTPGQPEEGPSFTTVLGERQNEDQPAKSEPAVRPARRRRRSSRVQVALASAVPMAKPVVAERERGRDDRAAIAPAAAWTSPAAVAPPLDPAAPAPVPAQAMPLVDHAASDPGLHATVLPQEARLMLASSDGDLALHLRVKDGQAEVRIGGSLAPMFESRAAEVRAALAAAGLDLGRFDLDQGGARDQTAAEDCARTGSGSAADSAEEPPVGSVRGRRIHVTA
jgi:hypothetical protein